MTMLAPAPATRANRLPLLPGWLAALLLLGATLVLAPAAGSLARPGFVLGCLAVSVYAWRQSPAAHLAAMLVLFSFSPFARRFVDLHIGFDNASLMLVGPLLGLLVPAPRLIRLLDGRHRPFEQGMTPMAVVVGCIAYAALIAIFHGAFMDAASNGLKWLAPIFYAAALYESGESRRRLVDAATNIFLLILPVMGVYGVLQYLDPPEWDRYWMQFAVAVTAGLPLPYEIRVYSTLNGPASFATFTAVGILLVAMLRPFWVTILTCGPAALALLLSQYRTAWMSLALGLIFCLLFRTTRGRTGLIFAGMAAGGMFALAIPKFSDALVERVQTFGQGGNDGSFQERLQQFMTLWSQPDSSLFGTGLTSPGDAGVAGAMPVDGMLIACWLTMGIVVGAICIAAFVWACGRMMANAWTSGRRDAVALGGLGCGALIHIPLASLANAELGVIFWIFAAMACIPEAPNRDIARW